MVFKMKIVITYGTYDYLHHGHICFLERAKKLGDYLIVGITSDSFDKQRGKLNVQQSLAQRIEAVRDTRLADLIIVEEYEGQKIEDIQKYHAEIFTVGSDWNGQFDYLNNYCQVIYLERTKGISSTVIREGMHNIIKLGCIGMENPTERFLKEIRYVSGVEITSCYCDSSILLSDNIVKLICDYEIMEYRDLQEFFDSVDAVYIATSKKNNFNYINMALSNGIHILCESPVFYNFNNAEQMYKLALGKKLILMEAIKTLYFPAFEHLMLLIGSRIIGDIIHIDVSCSQSLPQLDIHDKYQGSMYDFASFVLLPIFKLLGLDYIKCELKNYRDNHRGFCRLTSGYLEYTNSVAVFKAGKGVKTEGEMIITGTTGYIYIPAPWWKMDYFEVRYEDPRDTRKYFFKYEGEGFRYEISEFVRQINNTTMIPKWLKEESLAVTKIIEMFEKL